MILNRPKTCFEKFFLFRWSPRNRRIAPMTRIPWHMAYIEKKPKKKKKKTFSSAVCFTRVYYCYYLAVSIHATTACLGGASFEKTRCYFLPSGKLTARRRRTRFVIRSAKQPRLGTGIIRSYFILVVFEGTPFRHDDDDVLVDPGVPQTTEDNARPAAVSARSSCPTLRARTTV